MTSPSIRSGRDLVAATRPFAQEHRATSWFHVASTLGVLASSTALAALAPWWPVRLAAMALETLLMVRAFILYHDHLHGALLRGSPLGRALFRVQGVLMLTPPRVWADTHNFHHAHTARLEAPATGTFALWTVDRWRAATPMARLLYRLERNPGTMLLGHVTVFFIGMCVMPFVAHPKRYASSGVAAGVHVALGAAIAVGLGTGAFVCAFLVPFAVSSAIGTYLFYSQHNAPGITVHPDATWTYEAGALDASTYLDCGPVAHWFTGNIGYHHVHHLNARIPFYRLPEAMRAIPELQHPVVTTFAPSHVLACLRLALWDPASGHMVTFAEEAAAREREELSPAAGALSQPA